MPNVNASAESVVQSVRRMTPSPSSGSAAGRFAGLLPADFPAHARILHAAYDGYDRVRWARLGGRTGWRSFADRVGAEEDTPGAPPWRYPSVGSLDVHDLEALTAVLRVFTGTPDDLLVAVWTGGGASTDLAPVAAMTLPSRDCRVYAGDLDAVRDRPWSPPDAALPAPPTQWWPRDEAWVVATDVDADYTAVAGPVGLIDALLADRWLEVERADLSSPR